MNATEWSGLADAALHQTAYAIALFCLTVAFLLCFVILLFVLTITLELMGQSVYALVGWRPKSEERVCI